MQFLEVTSVRAGYGQVEVLPDTSLSVGKDEIVALVGANGAGKSTLINVLSGIVKATSGSVVFQGREIVGLPAHRLPELGIIQVPEGRRLFSNLSVRDNLALGAYNRAARRDSKESMERVFGLLPVLRERSTQLAGTMSGGQQQMLAIGRALMGGPRLLMLDEPSLGLAPIVVRELFELIVAVRDSGTSVLLVEQNVKHALSIADRAYALQQGRVVMTGTGKELLESDRLTAAMLGLDDTSRPGSVGL